MLRVDGRTNDDLRDFSLSPNVNRYAEGSCLVSTGHTKVYCTASVEDRQPRFLRDTQQGWVTAEYDMLPRATQERRRRDRGGRISGRTQEIQRIIGRSLRAITDLDAIGPRTIQLDCDVLQADGGTRSASICGAFVALAQACAYLQSENKIRKWPIDGELAAVSVGIVNGEILLDLCYEEDSRAAVDMNVIMASGERLVELQGSAEGRTFARDEADDMIEIAWEGLQRIFRKQQETLKGVGPYGEQE